MLKKLTAIFRFFVPTDDQVIARQIKDRHKRSTANLGGEADKALYKNEISPWRGPGGF